MSNPAKLGPASIPRLAEHVTMRFDEARDAWIIQAPERVLMLDEIAAQILNRCDGKTVDQIVDELAAAYDAPREAILGDVVSMLQDMADKGTIEV